MKQTKLLLLAMAVFGIPFGGQAESANHCAELSQLKIDGVEIFPILFVRHPLDRRPIPARPAWGRCLRIAAWMA